MIRFKHFLWVITGMIALVPSIAFYFLDGVQEIPEKYNPAYEVNRVADSLRKSGVDSLISYCSRCIDCQNLENKNASSEGKSIHETTPGYVFWIENGHYFIFKTDQFYSYHILECNGAMIYPVFDYFCRNGAAIAAIEKIENPSEKIKPGDSALKGTKHPDYLYLHRIVDPRQEFDHINLFVRCGQDSNRFVIERYPAQPNFEGTDSLGCGNSTQTYYYNLMLPRYEWLRMVESSLFTLEVKRAWKKK